MKKVNSTNAKCPMCGSEQIEREVLGKTTESMPEELFCSQCYTTIEDDTIE